MLGQHLRLLVWERACRWVRRQLMDHALPLARNVTCFFGALEATWRYDNLACFGKPGEPRSSVTPSFGRPRSVTTIWLVFGEPGKQRSVTTSFGRPCSFTTGRLGSHAAIRQVLGGHAALRQLGLFWEDWEAMQRYDKFWEAWEAMPRYDNFACCWGGLGDHAV